MSAVTTPEPATERACPRCGGPLAPDQEWCLSCGTAVRTRVASTPAWRAPMAIVGVLLALLAAALLLALVELSGDPQPVAKAPRATPAPAPAPSAPAPTPAPTAASSPGKPAAWPTGRSAWTVVLASTRSKAPAQRRARRPGASGAPVGVLNSSDYSSLSKGFWVVFSGQYESREAAAQAAEGFGKDAYPRRVVPR
ncbi:MAG TPA: SPOR domain-containing protein [Solirubrobacteraceae bacterium]|nr:SPOR domain-containing protein [Solirubrobacteraceae bacterium]